MHAHRGDLANLGLIFRKKVSTMRSSGSTTKQHPGSMRRMCKSISFRKASFSWFKNASLNALIFLLFRNADELVAQYWADHGGLEERDRLRELATPCTSSTHAESSRAAAERVQQESQLEQFEEEEDDEEISLSYNPELSNLYFSQPPSPPPPGISVTSSLPLSPSSQRSKPTYDYDDDDMQYSPALSPVAFSVSSRYWSKSPSPLPTDDSPMFRMSTAAPDTTAELEDQGDHVSQVSEEQRVPTRLSSHVSFDNQESDAANKKSDPNIPAITRVLGVRRRNGTLYAVVQLEDESREVYPTEYLQRICPLTLCHYYESIMEFQH